VPQIKNIARLSLAFGVCALFAYALGTLTFFCAQGSCAAAASWGVVGITGPETEASFGNAVSTPTHVAADRFFANAHRVVEAVGLYLVLIGVSLLLLIEVRHLLVARRLDARRWSRSGR
jgi:hypothetical protein